MEMMYTLIAEALKEERLDGIHHPTDYLNFFCLGNREPSQGNEPPPMATPNDSQVISCAFYVINQISKSIH